MSKIRHNAVQRRNRVASWDVCFESGAELHIMCQYYYLFDSDAFSNGRITLQTATPCVGLHEWCSIHSEQARERRMLLCTERNIPAYLCSDYTTNAATISILWRYYENKKPSCR